MKPRQKGIPSLFILVLMISVGPFGDTIYSPVLPSLQKAFETSYQNVQLTITLYLAGYAVSQILYGPLSDRFGRKKIMIFGAAMFLLGSSICLWSIDQGITSLLVGRFLQGLGVCAGAVISSSAVRDAFPVAQRGRVFAKMNAAFAAAPGVGGIVGTYVAWHISFIVLFVLAIVLLLGVIFLFPETLKNTNKTALHPMDLIKNYLQLFTAKGYWLYVIILGLNMGMIYTCLVEAPALVETTMQLNRQWFIVIAGGIVLAFIIGSIGCSFLMRKVHYDWILVIGMLIALSAGISLFIPMLMQIFTLWTLLPQIITLFVGIAFMVPTATAKALAPFELTAGSASAMMGFTQMGMASVITGGITFLPFRNAYIMPLTFISLTLIGLILLLSYIAYHRPKKSHII